VSARAAVAYAGPARPLLRAWKEHGLRRGADLAAELLVAQVPRPEADVITYIPPDAVRQLKRARHPAEQLAAALGQRWGLERAPLLVRAGSAGRQTGLRRDARSSNMRGAFTAARVPERVVLVDDVYTTGATVDAAAAALRRAGALRVEVVTFARTVR
jgi:predicted amidophosphoribosyltransferase